MSLRVRRATADDAEAIAEIGVAAWREGYRGIVPPEIDPHRAWNPERVRDRWDAEENRRAEAHVAELDGQVRGFISIGPSRDVGAGPGVGEVWVLNVHPDAWRRGLGRALVARAAERLREHGFREVTLWTPAESQGARAFYEAQGLVHDGAEQRRPQFGNALEVRYRMSL